MLILIRGGITFKNQGVAYFFRHFSKDNFQWFRNREVADKDCHNIFLAKLTYFDFRGWPMRKGPFWPFVTTDRIKAVLTIIKK